LSTGKDESLPEEDFALLDQVAPLTFADSFSFSDVRFLYKTNPGLKVPLIISSFVGGRFHEIDLTEDCASTFKKT